MRLRSRSDLVAVLVVGVLAIGACAGDDGDAGTDSNPASTPPVEPGSTAGSSVDANSEVTTGPTVSTTPTSAATTAAPSTTLSTTTAPQIIETTTVPPTSQPAPPPSPTGDEIRTAVETALAGPDGSVGLADRMAQSSIPGTAIAVVADGEIITSFGAGVTPGGTAPVDGATVMQAASLSKPIAAILAATLVADGEVDWDTDVETLLATSLAPRAVDTDEALTLDDLLSHRAGTNVDGFIGYATVDEAPSVTDVIAGAGDTPAIIVETEPGTAFQYSGGGYVVAGQALADANGTDFDSLVRDRVFDPVGMGASSFSLDPPDDVLDRASIGSIGGDPLEQGWQRHPEHAAAGLWTTADDLAGLLIAFGSSLQGRDGSLLPGASASHLVEPVAPTGITRPGYEWIGTGWFLDDGETPTTYRHNGRNVGYTSAMAGSTDGRFGVVVLTNSFPDGDVLADEVIATVAELQGWGS